MKNVNFYLAPKFLEEKKKKRETIGRLLGGQKRGVVGNGDIHLFLSETCSHIAGSLKDLPV